MFNILPTCLFTLAALTAIPAAAAASSSTVTIDLSGLKAGTGALYVSLQTRDAFMKPTGSYGTIIAKPSAGATQVTLTGVAAGNYAAAVWHDVNGDSKWDENDGWAMLDGDKLRAKPTFDQVSFSVSGADRTLALETRYGYGR